MQIKCEISKIVPHSGAIHGIGFIGTVVYFTIQATGFRAGVLGVSEGLL
ncbi:MAG TPA: hypothetical protein PK676_05050 [Bacteroidales bacterium]|nr:hypothetical protein [Bacteroidales bacterium]HQB56036.1 hypothetical protein [Bacteroidales bacterium]